jgi:hypothetical protein
MKTMVRPSFRAFFNLGPALLRPLPNLVFVALQRPPYRTLATPSQLPENPPGLRGVVLHTASLLDQMGHAPRSPHVGFITQRFWPALQPALDPP